MKHRAPLTSHHQPLIAYSHANHANKEIRV